MERKIIPAVLKLDWWNVMNSGGVSRSPATEVDVCHVTGHIAKARLIGIQLSQHAYPSILPTVRQHQLLPAKGLSPLYRLSITAAPWHYYTKKTLAPLVPHLPFLGHTVGRQVEIMQHTTRSKTLDWDNGILKVTQNSGLNALHKLQEVTEQVALHCAVRCFWGHPAHHSVCCQHHSGVSILPPSF